ncbi:MAG TPA: RNA-binding domain-containing protein [Methylomirabilota bacterium]|nr:RNA-binding domain-containing protein [Methylomirabilota bacterium]
MAPPSFPFPALHPRPGRRAAIGISGATPEAARRPSRRSVSNVIATTPQSTADLATEPRSSWYRIDLHLHTPASTDYQEPTVTPLEILSRAEERGMDIVAFTDHNSVRGYADLWREIEDLELLEFLKRIEPPEAQRLADYRRLLDKILLLPGFELTATFGFHVLAIFPERTSVRLMEHLLLLLGVPEARFGSGEVGATSDVLRAYEVLHDHGALVIGAHVNSANGVAMQGLRFGGQTKIAYTQDPHLHALEVTDLRTPANRRSTARFFNGTKPEYPRRMHCIQGSDAHRLERDPNRATNLGVGDRATEALLPDPSFAALKALFTSDDFSRTRPFIDRLDPFEVVRFARAEGVTATQAFHESVATKKTGMTHILRDAVAFANTDGGTIFIGASASDRRPVAGVDNAKTAIAELEAAIAEQIAPSPPHEVEVLKAGDKDVLALRLPIGPDRPYACGPGGIFVRKGVESALADRDEIVAMVRGSLPTPPRPPAAVADPPASPAVLQRERGPVIAEQIRRDVERSEATPEATVTNGALAAGGDLEEFVEQAPIDGEAPRIGVEIVAVEDHDGSRYYTLRDLRNGNLIHNVRRDTTRRLWRYAIKEYESKPVESSQARWHGDRGYLRGYRPRGEKPRHNLVLRSADGGLRVFYGVSDEGMNDSWKAVVPIQGDGETGRRGDG